MQRIGLIGAGRMGRGIAKNLRAAGYPLLIFKRSLADLDKRLEELREGGAELTDDLQEVFGYAEVLMTCLPSSVEVEEVMLGPKGLIHAEGASVHTVVDFTTARPASTRRIEARMKTRGIVFIDSPMTGGPVQAEAAELHVAVGGDRNVFDGLQGLFGTLAKDIIYAGPPGSGNCLKLFNNFLGLLHRGATSFLCHLAEKMDIPREKLYEFVSVSGGYSRAFETQMKWIMDDEHPLRFALALGLKDMRYTQEVAAAEGEKLAILDDWIDWLARAADAGYADKDVGSVYLHLKDEGGK